MVIFSYIWFQFKPTLQDYPIGWQDVLLAVLISSVVGGVLGVLGWRLAQRSASAA